MFAPDHEATAGELARVTKPGGQMALANCTPTGGLAKMFKVMAAYFAAPPPSSPFDWGDEIRVHDLLGESFDLELEERVSTLCVSSAEEYWELFSTSYGPTKTLADSMGERREEALPGLGRVLRDELLGRRRDLPLTGVSARARYAPLNHPVRAAMLAGAFAGQSQPGAGTRLALWAISSRCARFRCSAGQRRSEHQRDRGEADQHLRNQEPRIVEETAAAPDARPHEHEDDQRLEHEGEPHGDGCGKRSPRGPEPTERAVDGSAQEPPGLVDPAGAEREPHVDVSGVRPEVEDGRLGQVEAEERRERGREPNQGGARDALVRRAGEERHDDPGGAGVAQRVADARVLSLEDGQKDAEADTGEQEQDELAAAGHEPER
jgi:hypothetical protein